MKANLCEQCGAALPSLQEGVVTCGFCGTAHSPVAPSPPQAPAPVQVVQQTVVVATEGASAPVARCPHCNLPLTGATVSGVTLSGCGRCGGIWIDNDSARQLVSSPQRGIVELADLAAENTARNLYRRAVSPPCVTCGGVLVPVRRGELTLDVCELHGTWFDAGELSILVGRLLRAGAGAGRSPSTASSQPIACVGCKQAIDPAHVNLSGVGKLCDNCWRTTQSQLVQKAKDPGAILEAFADVVTSTFTGR